MKTNPKTKGKDAICKVQSLGVESRLKKGKRVNPTKTGIFYQEAVRILNVYIE